MQYGQVPNLDKKVSRLVQGSIMLSEKKMESGFALLDAAFAMGCNTIDGAHLYGGGTCERVLGRWMEARGNRDEIVVIGKAAHHNADRKRVTPFDIAADLHDSLARLRTDHIDLYFLHRDDPDVSVGPIVESLNEHCAAGRIRAFGGSNWAPSRIREANDYAAQHQLVPFVASSPNFTLAEQVQEPWAGCLTISGPSQEAARQWYAERHMPLFTWSSLARGFFSGRLSRANFEHVRGNIDQSCVHAYCYEQNFQRLDRVAELAREKGKSVPQIALAWVLQQPLNIFALVGCETPDEFKANCEALEFQLSETELAWIDLRRESR